MCLRVGAELRATVTATSLPFVALHIREVRTVARERPAVVQGPLDFAVVGGEPLEQHLDVDVVAVQVVQVHDVGVYLIETLEQAPRRSLGVKARLAVEARLQRIEPDLGIGGKPKLATTLPGAAAAPKGEGVLACSEELPVLPHHDAAGRAVRHGIYVGVDSH